MRRRLSLLVSGSIVLACLLGAVAGVGTYTFYYARGASYLSDDANACANCHAMQPHYDAWLKSSHGKVAVCNDCHAPHDSVVSKYYCKARNGFFHSLAFTTGRYPDVVMMHDYNREITEQACRDCHAPVVEAIDVHAFATSSSHGDMSCIRCHRDVGHLD